MEYREFRVVVMDTKNVLIIKPPKNEPMAGKIRADPLKDKTINIFSDWLSQAKITAPEELVVLGSNLYNLLFDNELSAEFKKVFDEVKGQQPASIRLRLVLEFKPDARDLAEYPWEYIYYPDTYSERGFFIAAESRLILARHVPNNVNELKNKEGKLRVLIVVSTPREEENRVELGPVNEGPAVKAIEDFQKSLPNTIDIKRLDQPTRLEFKTKVDGFRPHVLHFIGHGKYEGKEGGSLSLVQEEDKKVVDWINEFDLTNLFSEHQPYLIFLHACEGAFTDSYNAFRGLALQLVYSKVRAVVAMQYKVANSVANLFTKRFYESLGRGERIDEAVQDGRLELLTFLNDKKRFNGQAFGCPVVFIQDAEGIIIANKKDEEEDQQQTKYPCPYCQQPVLIKQKFCFECGNQVACLKCLGTLPRDVKFCAECGTRVDRTSSASNVIQGSVFNPVSSKAEPVTQSAPTTSGVGL